MSRRCKPGQRARIIGDSRDAGQIVLVVRHYFYPEKVNGATWSEDIFPWVATSLGAPLNVYCTKTREELPPARTVVIDDCYLEPLDDDDDGLSDAELIHKPVATCISGLEE